MPTALEAAAAGPAEVNRFPRVTMGTPATVAGLGGDQNEAELPMQRTLQVE